MRTARFSLLAVVVIVVVASGHALLRSASNQSIAQDRSLSIPKESNTELVRMIDDVMKQLGYAEDAYGSRSWAAPGCPSQTFLISPASHKLFLFTQNRKSGEVKTITLDEINEALHRYIAFQGSFGESSIEIKNRGMFFPLGFTPDPKQGTMVYIHFDQEVCNVVVDEIMYTSPWETRFVPVRLELIP